MLKVRGLTKTFLSKLFSVSRKSLYLKSGKQSVKDENLKNLILDTLIQHPAYGQKRLSLELKINKKRIKRVIKIYGIKTYRRKKKFIKLDDLGNPASIYPNLIKNSCAFKPNTIFVGDFTYLKVNGRFLYLATFLDQFTREIVGFTISSKHNKILCIEALLDAIKNVGKPMIIHTDQGSEYNSREFIKFAEKFLNIKISMSTKGSPWQNGYQESYYSHFKVDLSFTLNHEQPQTEGELIEAVYKTISYYNNQRMHSVLETTPSKFKQNYLQKLLTL